MADDTFVPPVILAADTVDGQTGIFSRLSDAVSRGIPTAAISGALSVYNTALDYAGKEAVSISDTIRQYDENWGNYYQEHQNAIDFAGFAATSLIPGTLGMKALKLAQAGEAVGPISRALSLTSSRKGQYLEAAMRELGASGGTITSQVAAAKRAQLIWATADQTLAAAASELAVVATMNDSPIFEGNDWVDFTKNVALGAVFGGAIGGLIEHAGTRGILKSVQGQIEQNRRLFDTVFDPAKLGLSKADEVLNFVENIVKLPDDAFSTTVKFRADGKIQTRVLDTSAAFTGVRDRAEKVAFDTAKLKFNELADGGEVTGQAMFKFIHKQVVDGRAANLSAETILDNIQGYLQGVKRVMPLTEESAAYMPPKQFFITKEPTGLDDIFSEIRSAKTGKQAFYLATDDPTKIKFGSVARLGYQTAQEAFDDGYDAVMTTLGRVAINPKSKVVLRTPDMAMKNKFYLDLPSGKLTSDPVVLGADLIHSAKDFVAFKDGVRIAGKQYAQAMGAATSISDSALKSSARFMWAKEGVTDAMMIKQRVFNWNDFPLLDRLRSMDFEQYVNKDLAIRDISGAEVKLNDIVNVPAFINEQKLLWLEKELGKEMKGVDTRILAAHLNVDRQWVEDAITNNYRSTRDLSKAARSLEEYFNPQTVELEWDRTAQQAVQHQGPIGPNHMSTVVLSHHYALITRQRVGENAAASVLGDDFHRLPDAAEDLSTFASERGAGASTLGASNADYGKKAQLWVQETGKQVALISQKWRDAAIEALSSKITPVRDSREAAAELGVITTALRKDAQKYVLDTDAAERGIYRLIDRRVKELVESGDTSDYDEAIEFVQNMMVDGKPLKGAYNIKNKEVYDFLKSSTEINKNRISQRQVLGNAAGLKTRLDGDVVYAPPVDTRRYPFHAFVSAKERIGNPTDVTMITAKSEEQLRFLASQVGDDYEIIYKADTAKYFKAKGTYDYNLQMNEVQVNSALQRTGKLSDFFPETRAENILEDYVRWHANAEENTVRLAAQVKSRQFFSEMQFLSEQFTAASTSVTRGFGAARSKIADPFGDYIKTALNINKQSEYPLLDSLNEFVDKIGTKTYKAIDDAWTSFRQSGGKDLASLEYTNSLMEEAGLGHTYGTNMAAYLAANEKVPRNLIKEGFQKVNYWLATATLRLDLANSIINTISTPIMLGTEVSSIKHLIRNDPETAGKLAELMSVKVPGQELRVPSTTKLIGNSIKNFFGKDKQALIQRYTDNGDIKTTLQLYHEVLDDLAYTPNKKPAEWVSKLNGAVEKGAQLTGSNFAEQFTRFVSADVMRQISDPLVAAGKMTLKEQNSYISSFVNRVQGNYIASQRPVIFQGTTGAAVGLFQTYAFNVLQQLLRHVENRDARTMLTFGGLQSAIYGFNGLPFFDAINTHLIGNASGNKDHQDAYSLLPQADKEFGDWMLYGTASAFPLFGEKWPSLYTRGDINPRHLSIVPINPLDIPAVSASIKLAGTIATFGKNAANGADLSMSFLQALEHHGWNRPLAGFAQLLAGQSTTSKGGLISAANDLETTSMLARIPDRIVNYGGVARLMGSRPMDESVALSGFYRNKTYEATDRARLEAFGQAVKTKLYNNQMPNPDDLDTLMSDYVNAGGRIETFSSSMQRWMKDTNTSVINQMANHLGSPSAKKMQMLMGGEPLQDYNSLATGED